MVRSEAGSALFVGGAADAVAALWRRGRSCGGVLPVFFGSLCAVNELFSSDLRSA